MGLSETIEIKSIQKEKTKTEPHPLSTESGRRKTNKQKELQRSGQQ